VNIPTKLSLLLFWPGILGSGLLSCPQDL
jgi:hypothetical protein